MTPRTRSRSSGWTIAHKCDVSAPPSDAACSTPGGFRYWIEPSGFSTAIRPGAFWTNERKRSSLRARTTLACWSSSASLRVRSVYCRTPNHSITIGRRNTSGQPQLAPAPSSNGSQSATAVTTAQADTTAET